MSLKFSLIIPCFNEEGNIRFLFNSLLKLKLYKNLEIILVDNGSKDFTLQELFFLKKKNKDLNIRIVKIDKNIGFGNGVYQGLKIAKGKFLCYTHADREAKISEIKKVFKIINKTPDLDILVKGRRINRIKNHWTALDEIFSRGCDLILSIILFKPLIDIHAQPNAFPRKLLKKLRYYPNDFLFDAYIYFVAKKLKYKMIRFGVNFNKKSRKYGKGSSEGIIKKLKGGFEHIFGAVKILIKSNI